MPLPKKPLMKPDSNPVFPRAAALSSPPKQAVPGPNFRGSGVNLFTFSAPYNLSAFLPWPPCLTSLVAVLVWKVWNPSPMVSSIDHCRLVSLLVAGRPCSSPFSKSMESIFWGPRLTTPAFCKFRVQNGVGFGRHRLCPVFQPCLMDAGNDVVQTHTPTRRSLSEPPFPSKTLTKILGSMIQFRIWVLGPFEGGNASTSKP